VPINHDFRSSKKEQVSLHFGFIYIIHLAQQKRVSLLYLKESAFAGGQSLLSHIKVHSPLRLMTEEEIRAPRCPLTLPIN
jgi:hypothetical protein